ncbi:MAG: lasso peptide biosynthesis B2 protein [Burkholderiales bacterium]|nr:lasso peptide biosynthesis B2 protein [Burkholderiales bacterium]
MSGISRKFRNFFGRPSFERRWLLPVWLLLGISRFLILFVPFRKLAPFLGFQTDIAPFVPLVDSETEARARSIARVVQLAARFTPWVSNCFPQAIAARILLGIYGIPYAMFFGVDREASCGISAHAWVACGKIRVTGGQSFGRFAVVGCFSSIGFAQPLQSENRK